MMEMIKYLWGWVGESGFSSNSTAEEVTPQLPSITAIITGATSGIGQETARVLAKRGVHLVLPVRNTLDALNTKANIISEFPKSKITLMILDLTSFKSIRSFVAEFMALNIPLNLLINNAGVYSHNHAISEDGIEITFATNYLGHFLLTKLLLDKMVETATKSGIQGRIVNVTSNFHKWFFGDIISYLRFITKDKSKYDGTYVYALSKLANVLHTKELAFKLKKMDANMTANCVNPGITRTRLTREREGLITGLVFFLASKFVKNIHQAAATTCYVATNDRLKGISGKYFSDCNEAYTSALGSDSSEASRLWYISELLVSSTDPDTIFHC